MLVRRMTPSLFSEELLAGTGPKSPEIRREGVVRNRGERVGVRGGGQGGGGGRGELTFT